MKRFLAVALLLGLGRAAVSAEAAVEARLAASVDELSHAIGRWAVVTEFLKEDGSVAKAAEGSYEFAWVVPERVVTGRSAIPELRQSAGILFYVNEAKDIIEMVSVGADGRLWVMTGALGGDTRYTQEFDTSEGGRGQLRFTRYNVSADAFESRMEYTEDGGATWKPGNHQVFRRQAATGP